MTVTSRRPRFGDVVVLHGERYTVVATVCAPHRGYWIRPAGADDASRDRFLPLPEWAALEWDARAQRWELAA